MCNRKVPPIHHKHIDWLNEQLPTLIQQDIISTETAQRLKAYYEPHREAPRNQLLLVFSVLGTVLIMTGIISLLAYNWDAFSREFKLGLSVGILLLSQLVAGWAYVKRSTSSAWREGTAIAVMAAVFISIALISQVYHLGGEIGDYLWMCAWLSLPLAYLLQSTMVAGLYLLAAFACTLAGLDAHQPVFWYWLMLAGAFPYMILHFRTSRYGLGTQYLTVLTITTVFFLVGVTFSEKLLEEWWLFVYLHLLALCTLLGHYLFAEARRFWQNPLAVIGNTGILGIAFIFSSYWSTHTGFYRRHESIWLNATAIELFLLVLLVGTTWGLGVQAVMQRRWNVVAFISVVLPAVLTQWVILSEGPVGLGTLCFNLYLLAVSIVSVVQGLKNQQAGLFNGGVSMFSLLLLLRFMDSDLGFVVKGVAFIVIGMMFLGVNIWYSKTVQKQEVTT